MGFVIVFVHGDLLLVLGWPILIGFCFCMLKPFKVSSLEDLEFCFSPVELVFARLIVMGVVWEQQPGDVGGTGSIRLTCGLTPSRFLGCLGLEDLRLWFSTVVNACDSIPIVVEAG